MNPQETNEIQRQVDDLLAKGMIRESLSPYVVPAVLVPKKDSSMRMCRQQGHKQDHHQV